MPGKGQIGLGSLTGAVDVTKTVGAAARETVMGVGGVVGVILGIGIMLG